jgi:hypothetical protein
MNPVIPIIALGALLAIALGARGRKSQVMPLALPAPRPELPESHRRAPERRAVPATRPAPATRAAPPPSPPRVEAPPQTLPELAEQAQAIFAAPAAPPLAPATPAGPLVTPPRAAPPASAPLAAPLATAPAPAVVLEQHAPATIVPGTVAPRVTPPPPATAVPATPSATAVPAGFDPEGARRVAPRVATHLRNRGAVNYSRQTLREFQTLAGLKADGLYGGRTAGALRHYLGGANPPAPMFRPLQEVPYSLPGS